MACVKYNCMLTAPSPSPDINVAKPVFKLTEEGRKERRGRKTLISNLHCLVDIPALR